MAAWWPFVVPLTVLALVFGIVVYHGYRRPLSRLGRWSGIPKRRKQDGIEPAKTLWDWLNLLGVPLTVALVGIGYSISARQADLEIAEQHREADQRIADDRAMDDALKSYIDAMGGLLTDMGLSESEPPEHVRNLARAYTLTLLERVDGRRKGLVVEFLYEAELITISEVSRECKVELHEANLTYADLNHAFLKGADFHGANLHGAELQGAFLRLADLHQVNLQGADLEDAVLEGADLAGATLNNANLNGANLGYAILIGAVLNGATINGATLQGADLRSVSLKGIEGLSPTQLNTAKTFQNAVDLPEYLTPDIRPWPRPTEVP